MCGLCAARWLQPGRRALGYAVSSCHATVLQRRVVSRTRIACRLRHTRDTPRSRYSRAPFGPLERSTRAGRGSAAAPGAFCGNGGRVGRTRWWVHGGTLGRECPFSRKDVTAAVGVAAHATGVCDRRRSIRSPRMWLADAHRAPHSSTPPCYRLRAPALPTKPPARHLLPSLHVRGPAYTP